MNSYLAKLDTAAQHLIAPSSAADEVYIMEMESFSQSFPYARPINLKVNNSAKLTQHPLEDGTTISDHLVLAPITIDITMIFIQKFRDTYAKIQSAFETGRFFTIQTKTHNFSNMVLTALPHEETTQYWDVVLVNLRFQEARFIRNGFGMLSLSQVKNTSDVSTLILGSLQTSLCETIDTTLANFHYKNAKL